MASAISLAGFLQSVADAVVRRPSLAACTALLALFGLSSAVSTVRQYLRLRHIKGPPGTGFSKFWLLKTVGGSTAYLDFWGVTKQYGSIARIGPNDIITSDPELMKHVLAVRTEYRRSSWYDGMRFNPARDNCLSWRDEDMHMNLRSKMAAGYSGREIENLEAKIDENIAAWMNLLDSYVAKDQPFDLGLKAQYFTLDVISHIAFGKPFGFIETDSDVYDYIKTTEETVPMAMVTTVLPWLAKLLRSPIFKAVLPSERDPLGFGKVMAIAKACAAERFGPEKQTRKDMLGSFVSHGLNQAEVESEILLQIIAGSDTTATAIRSTLLHIITNPRVNARLLEEIRAAAISTPIISDAQARTMPYLQAVIKEGLRIWPPVAGLMAKETPPQGDTWKGVHIPGGTRIGYCAWGIFRDKEFWGVDAGDFRPERWLDSDTTRVKEMDSTLDLVFSYGRWQCLGRPVAMMELNKVFVQVSCFGTRKRTFRQFFICSTLSTWPLTP
ncbi:hypothetical protein NLU13_4815 [Sarocladium strictum]|uniref:Pisatin demethylase n=1 Tax=Sarocladium strictum TaxID=5046 RepID=A0AA39GM76_SARSR|nr:hypothetical protein NLU13_4815 [Sarocladium strictum]